MTTATPRPRSDTSSSKSTGSHILTGPETTAPRGRYCEAPSAPLTYLPVGGASWQDAARVAGADAARRVEAGDAVTGKRVAVVAIRAGMSLNRRNYGPGPLKAAVEAGMFRSCPVYANHPGHMLEGSHDIRCLVGEFVNGTWDPAVGAQGAVVGEVEFLDDGGADVVRIQKVMATKPHLMAFSVMIGLDGEDAKDDEGWYFEVTKVEQMYSLDLVDFPGAGGGVIGVTESAPRGGAMKEQDMGVTESEIKVQLLEQERSLEAKHKEAQAQAEKDHAKALSAMEAKVADLTTRLTAAEAKATDAEKQLATAEAKLEAAEGKVRQAEVVQALESRLGKSQLPQATKRRLRESFAKGGRTAEDVETAVTAAEEHLAEITEELGLATESQGNLDDEDGSPVVGAGEDDPPRPAARKPAKVGEAAKLAAAASKRVMSNLGLVD